MGTWALPDDQSKIDQLGIILSNLEDGCEVTAQNLDDWLYNILGDDDLFDNLYASYMYSSGYGNNKDADVGEVKSTIVNNAEVLKIIKKKIADWIADYEQNPKSFEPQLDIEKLRLLITSKEEMLRYSNLRFQNKLETKGW